MGLSAFICAGTRGRQQLVRVQLAVPVSVKCPPLSRPNELYLSIDSLQ